MIISKLRTHNKHERKHDFTESVLKIKKKAAKTPENARNYNELHNTVGR